MKSFRLVEVLTICAIMGTLFTGCAWSIGDSKGHSTTEPTRGQELVDLKRAKDQGAISDSEYEAQKQKILSR